MRDGARAVAYTCPVCHRVTFELPHLDRVLCGSCGRWISHELPLSQARAACLRVFGLAETQENPVEKSSSKCWVPPEIIHTVDLHRH